MSDLFCSVRRENINRKNARETVWVSGYSIGNIRIVVAVTSGSLHQSRFRNSRLTHRRNHPFHAYGSFARPVGFVTAERSVPIALRIGADHMRVDVDRHGVIRQSSPPALRLHIHLSRYGTKEIVGIVKVRQSILPHLRTPPNNKTGRLTTAL